MATEPTTTAAETDRAAMRWLAVIITVGFFIVLGILMWRGIPTEGRDAVLLLLGSLSTAWLGVVGFYFRAVLVAPKAST